MADLTMADVRAKFPQYNDMSDDDLAAALHKQFYSDMPADQFAAKIGYAMPAKPSIAPNTGLAGSLGSAVEAGMGPVDTLASAASHAATGALDPLIATGARIYAMLRGEDPDVAADAVHHWAANQGTYHAVTPTGKTVGDAANQVLGAVASPFNAAGNALDAATGHNPTLEHAAGATSDALGAASLLAPGVSEAVDAARGVNAANPANIARTGAKVAEQAGYKGLQSQQDLRLPGAQQVTDKMIADDAGVPQGQTLSVPAVQDARAAGPAKVYDAAKAAMPASLTQDAPLQQTIAGIGDTTSQLPRSPDVDAVKQSMLNQPDMTRDQLFANVQQARERAANFLASDDPDKLAVGQAYHSLADAYEDFIGRQLEANPNAGVTLDQFQQARTQFAKNYAAEAALKGGEHIDPMVYSRILQKDPNLLTGNSKIVGQVAASLPAAPPFGVERGLVHGIGSIGAGVGTGALAHMMGAGPGAEIAAGAGASVAAPYVARFLHNMFATGDVGAAGATAQNPALSYFFKDGQMPDGWNRAITQRPPLLLGHDAPPTMTQTGETPASTEAAMADMGLTPGGIRAGAAHPGSAARTDMTPGAPTDMGVLHPPLTQNWSGAGPDGVINRSTASGVGGANPPDTRDFAAALSSLVPDNILQRTAGAGGSPLFEALNRSPDQLSDELNELVKGLSPAETRGGVANRGSNDGGVSPEFANAQDADRASGVQRSVIDPDGRSMPVNGLAARDLGVTGNSGGASVPKGHIAIEERRGQPPTIINRGGLSPQTAQGLLNRFLATRSNPGIADLLGM